MKSKGVWGRERRRTIDIDIIGSFLIVFLIIVLVILFIFLFFVFIIVRFVFEFGFCFYKEGGKRLVFVRERR